MEASEVLYTTPAAIAATNTLSTEMSLTPTTQTQLMQQQQQQPTPLSPLVITTTTTTTSAATTTAGAAPITPTTPRTTTHTPREIPTMYILDQMYDDYMDQYNGNNITTPTEEPESSASLELVPCPICSRTFNPVTLRKHVGICEKMTTKKRNIFDSSRQRREGTDLATYPLPKNFGLPEKAISSTSITQPRNERGQSPKPAQQVSSPNLTRKKPSEDLIRSTARASMRKAVSSNNNTPTSTTAPSTNFTRDRMRSSERSLTRSRGIQPPPAEQCPHCERCFGIKAYDRHVEWCKEKALQASIKQGSSKNDGNVAKARLEARTKYRAPCLKTKRSLNREKYSGLAGEEHENDDTTKASKTNGSKTQENSLMSMSMTSSMCSERKITNSTTGNLNEPVKPATYKEQSTIDYSSIGSRKCTRDKSQTPQPPTTIKPNRIAAAAAAATENVRKLPEEETIINLKIQMPEFHLLGEQMTATAINKKRKTKLKVDALTAAKIKPQKLKDLQQQQQLPEFQKHIQTKKPNQKLKKTTDVELNLPVISSSVVSLEQKKSVSDLSLRTMQRRRFKCLQAAASEHKAFDNDHEDHLHDHVVNNVSNHNEVKFEVNEAPAENEELMKSLTFYNSAKGNKEIQLELPELGLKISQDCKESNVKMTMQQYFEREENFMDFDKQYIEANHPECFEREKKKEEVEFLTLSNDFTENLKFIECRENDQGFAEPTENQSFHLQREEQFDDLIMKQSYPKSQDYDSEEIMDEDFRKNSILLSIPKLDLPTTPIKSLSKQKTVPKAVRKSPSLTESQKREIVQKSLRETENEKRVISKESKVNNKKPHGTVASHMKTLSPDIPKQNPIKLVLTDGPEMDIYKDCLTDSDELRRHNETSQEQITKEVEKEDLDDLSDSKLNDISSDMDLKTLKSSSKSHTFIRDLQQPSYELKEFKDNSEKLSATLKPIKYSKSSEDLYQLKTNPKNSSPQLKERPGTPRTPNALRLPRLGTPPPPQQLSTTAPTTPKSENSTTRLKSLNICQTKRKKVLRQTVSCSNTSPMKAMVPFSKECLELCGVISAPQLKSTNIKQNTMKEDGELAKLEYQEEGTIDFVEEEEEQHCFVYDKDIKVIKEPPTTSSQLKRNKSFTVSGLPDNYDPFLSAKRQLEELCSPTNDSVDIPTTPQTPQLPSMPATPNSSHNNNNNSSINKMSTSLILSSSTPINTPNLMTTSQIPQQTQKTPTLARSSSFRRTSSLRGPRRSPMLSARPPLFAQKHRPTIQRGLSDEGPISTNFLKPEEYDEMPVRSVCVNDFAANKSPRVVRRDTSASNRKQPLKLNINAANANGGSASVSPNIMEPEVVSNNTASKYVSKTDSLAVFLKYEHELEKLNQSAADKEHKKENLVEVKTPSTASTVAATTPVTNLDGPLNAKELKDKSNNLSKQNSAKNIKADILAATEGNEQYEVNVSNTNELELNKYGQQRLAPLSSKPTTPLTKPQTPQLQTPTAALTPLNVKNSSAVAPTNQEHKSAPKSPKPVALSSIFGGDTNKTAKHSALLYTERKNSMGSDYIDPKLINKCDNLPINLNLKRTDFKHSDSDTSETRLEQFSSSSSSESSAPAKKTTSLQQQTKFLPTVKQQQQQQQPEQNNNLNPNQNHLVQQQQQHQQLPNSIANSQRNSAEGRNLLKRRMRLGRNQFLYDASPEGDSCSADDEGANRSSLEGDTLQHHNLLREHEKAFERLSAQQQLNPVDAAPFIPPLPAFDDFDFEEFLSSFENDEEQFPLFKDCREFLMNRTSKKQRSMLMANSITQNPTNTNNIAQPNNSTNFKKSSSPQTFPPLTPQSHSTGGSGQHFQFPTLPQHPKNLFNSFSLNTRSRNKYEELSATKSTDAFCLNSNMEQFKDHSLNQKREIFISIETEQNDLDKSPISPNSIRNMVGNPQTVVEVEVDAAHDNKFSKISDDDEVATAQNLCRSKNFAAHTMAERLPNVQLNNAKNLMQKMHEDFRQMGEEMSGNLRLTTMEHRATAPMDMNSNANMPVSARKMNRTAGTPSGDAYGDSDELSSLDGYPLSSPNSRLGVSSKTSADSAYGSLSRQRSSELTSQRSSSRSRPMTSNTANCLLNRPLTEETSLGRSRQLSASSSSSSEHALPPISSSNSFHKQQQHQLAQQQQLYNNNTNNNNNISPDLDELMRYERHSNNNNNNNYEPLQPSHATLTGATNSHSNLESLQQYPSNSTMSSSMKISKFCHECGSKFLLDQAKFCMECGVKRIVL